MTRLQTCSPDATPEPEAEDVPLPTNCSRILLGLIRLNATAPRAAVDERPGAAGSIVTGNVLDSLMAALRHRDPATAAHCERVAALAAGFGQSLGLEPAACRMLEIAGLLHDIGKIGVPDSILFKPGPLTPEEKALMDHHYQVSLDILQACRADPAVLSLVAAPHAWSGGSAPEGKVAGTAVALGGRILAIADAYDAMVSNRPYRKTGSRHRALGELVEASGTQFDPELVALFSRWVVDAGPAPGAAEAARSALPQVPPPARKLLDDPLEIESIYHIFSYLYILESLYDGFYIVDPAMRVLIWNQGAARLLDAPAAARLGAVWSSQGLDYFDERGHRLDPSASPLRRALATGQPVTSTGSVRRRDGAVIRIESQVVPIRDAQGRLNGVAEIFRDLSRETSLAAEYQKLKRLVTLDSLTQVNNRGEFDRRMDQLVAESSAGGRPWCLALSDIDHFKSINDRFGHRSGDEVLVHFAQLLQDHGTAGDMVARYGGEEFAVVWAACDLDTAYTRVERVRHAVAAHAIPALRGRRLTVSFGLTEFQAHDTVESLIRRADRALYTAKKEGRNRTIKLMVEPGSGRLGRADGTIRRRSRKSRDVVRASFTAWLPLAVTVRKISGFIMESDARILEWTASRARIEVGRRSLLPAWGMAVHKLPVEIELQFEDWSDPSEADWSTSPNGKVQVQVAIHPIGLFYAPAAFESRCRGILSTLRSYLMAE